MRCRSYRFNRKAAGLGWIPARAVTAKEHTNCWLKCLVVKPVSLLADTNNYTFFLTSSAPIYLSLAPPALAYSFNSFFSKERLLKDPLTGWQETRGSQKTNAARPTLLTIEAHSAFSLIRSQEVPVLPKLALEDTANKDVDGTSSNFN